MRSKITHWCRDGSNRPQPKTKFPSIQAAQLRQLGYEIFAFGKNRGRAFVNDFAASVKRLFRPFRSRSKMPSSSSSYFAVLLTADCVANNSIAAPEYVVLRMTSTGARRFRNSVPILAGLYCIPTCPRGEGSRDDLPRGQWTWSATSNERRQRS